MFYLLLIITAVIITVLLLNIRVRVNLNSEQWLLFIGLGQSGPEYDFISKTGRLNLFGFKIKSFKRVKKPKEKPPSPEPKKKAKAKRKRSLSDFLRIIPRCSQALGIYLLSLMKAVIVEELEGEVEAGFESPDITGTVFGYYQAALAAAPAVMGRIHYIPNWDKATFDASFRAAIAIPLYKIIFGTIILIIKLPLRDLIKLAIGKKKGASDG
ncbi:MAG: hypothetical protein ACE5D6_00170 [Candidatus Zixiibacteriota bacterium]